jgi:hypothetical protein
VDIRRITNNSPSEPTEPIRQSTDLKINQPNVSSSGVNDLSDIVERSTVDAFGEMANGGAVDPNALVQEVLRESYLQTTEDLRFYAEKVKSFNGMKSELTDRLSQNGFLTQDQKNQIENSSPGNVMETLSSVLKESIKDSNEDKHYYLNKVEELNQMAEQVINYQGRLVDKSGELAADEGQETDQRHKDD